MTKKIKQILSFALCVIMTGFLLNACSKKDSTTNDTANNKERTVTFTDSLAFIEADGDTAATIAIAVADGEKERRLGLMYVTELEQDEGMIFIFKKKQPLSFWMANTPLSLDIIFVNADKEIVRIHHSTPPFSHNNFKSGEPALYAVEVNAGFSVAHDIREGMEIRF